MSALTFFDGYMQEPVSIRGVPGKSPMFFRDFHLMGAVFWADARRVKEALPQGRYRASSASTVNALSATPTFALNWVNRISVRCPV